MSSIQVTKASGEQQPFDESKLRRSLKNAGATQELIEEIVSSIHEQLFEGIPTEKIYKEAFRILKARSHKTAGRYKLKEAIFELGPDGYHFETFVAELLKRQGYKTETGVIVKGDCVNHEIDVIAYKDNEYLLVECKFHNRKENRCNVKVPLYIQSRLLDVKKNWSNQPGHQNHVHRGWVVTNTRFTEDALTYGECAGLKMLSWDFPKDNGIKDLITRLNLHPVTSLSSLSKQEKKHLLIKKILFCKQICENQQLLKSAGIDPRKISRIAKEAMDICNNFHQIS
jgi:Holliday junction resolvase-like predicted endonuclease